MNPEGLQLTAELIGCHPPSLKDASSIKQATKEAIVRGGLNCLAIKSHQFRPQGLTVIAIISESHLAIHTYPETSHVSLDIFTCRNRPITARRILRSLRNFFRPKQIKVLEIKRGQGLSLIQNQIILDQSPGNWQVQYQIKKILYQKQSDHQKIEVIKHADFGNMLFLDGELQGATNDGEIYDLALTQPLTSIAIKDRPALILGGGDGGGFASSLNPSSEPY